jgi:hypothetical protein
MVFVVLEKNTKLATHNQKNNLVKSYHVCAAMIKR